MFSARAAHTLTCKGALRDSCSLAHGTGMLGLVPSDLWQLVLTMLCGAS